MSKTIHQFEAQFCKAKVPDVRPGYLVAVHQKIKEGNKERVQVFQGTVIATNAGHGVNDTFTVRKVSEGIGVEKTFPVHSPTIVKIEVIRAHKVRRAKLNYLRDLSGKALRMKEVPLELQEKAFELPKPETAEAPVSEAKAAETAETPAEAPEEATAKTPEVTEEVKAETKKEAAPADEAEQASK